MAIKQTISYNSDSKYFAGFLQNIIDDSEIDGHIVQNDKYITMFLDDSDLEALERFSKNSQAYLPHSIFLGDVDTQSIDQKISKESIKSKSYNISLCPKCIDKLTNPSSEFYLDDSLFCNHYSNEDILQIQDSNTYSANYKEGDTVLITDSSVVNELFLLTEDEIKALFSIEKPTIKATIKDQELIEITGKKFIDIKSPNSVKAIMSSLNAKESGLKYLFFNEQKGLIIRTIKQKVLIIKDTLKISKSLENLDEDSIKNRFLNIAKEVGIGRAICANLSVDSCISFLTTDKGETSTVLRIGFLYFRILWTL